MGNKSKQRAKPGKWSQVRDLIQSRQAKSRGAWMGPQARQESKHLRVIFSGGTALNEKRVLPEINESPQPWQKLAAKATQRIIFTNLGWNARREARERRKTQPSAS